MRTEPWSADIEVLASITASCARVGFELSCEPHTGALLRTLAAAKPGGRVLELGTGAGMSAAWLLAGMTADSTLLTVESEAALVRIAEEHHGDDPRVRIVHDDAGALLDRIAGERFDLIFADTWVGKFERLDEALELLAPGALYVVDDLLPQATWPDGHATEADALLDRLLADARLVPTPLHWSSGLLVAARV
ncbi:O-methyltransferase [Streptomyces sp. NPDC058231]|uniref:O-methyltransferase n=1 Tax=Streptomyces sp. NPDC058231 TaxID=3346392 RepID=UPI0036E30F0E